MTDSDHLTNLIHEAHGGSLPSREELFRLAQDRLTNQARRMFRDFPRLQRWVDSSDVYQEASIRLHKALSEVRPASTTEFLALSATILQLA